jgi:DeoR/GlpR family transcriptional regulator of sugar metabolism
VVADATKLGQRALVTVCPLSAIDVMVTNLPPPAVFERLLREAEVEIVITGPADEELAA